MAEAADEALMRVALREAEAAERAGEVPIGAVIAVDGRIIAKGRNRPIAGCDPSAHAEIVALRAAGRRLSNYRLSAAELVVTVEPCIMCVGAILQARVCRVVFGCADAKGGALGGMVDLSSLSGANHRFAVTGGVLAAEARALLQRFFRHRRRVAKAS